MDRWGGGRRRSIYPQGRLAAFPVVGDPRERLAVAPACQMPKRARPDEVVETLVPLNMVAQNLSLSLTTAGKIYKELAGTEKTPQMHKEVLSALEVETSFGPLMRTMDIPLVYAEDGAPSSYEMLYVDPCGVLEQVFTLRVTPPAHSEALPVRADGKWQEGAHIVNQSKAGDLFWSVLGSSWGSWVGC